MLDNIPFITFSILYNGMMVYGLSSLASYWGFIHLRPKGSREIPDMTFCILGMALPAVGWLGCFVTPWAVFVLPGSLGLMWLMAERRERRAERTLAAMRGQEIAHAERMIAEDAGNASAHWARAQACERGGDLGEALRSYRRASALCQKTLPEGELEEIETRLTAAMAEGGAGSVPWEEPAVLKRLRWLEMTWVLAVLGSLLAFWNWAWAVNVVSTMVFLRWLHGEM